MILASVILLVTGSVVLYGTATGAPTGGSGAVFTDRTFQPFTASNGLNSQYHIYAANLATTSPLCAVFQFHGDGAYEFKNPASSYSLGGSAGIVAESRERGCLTVPVLTPDKVGSLTWWESGSANALFFRDLLNEIKSEYNIDSERIWLVGYSGGSQFITKFYVPQYSSTIDGGGSIVFGGGGAPYSVPGSPYAAELVSRFHMHWYTGANDDGSSDGYNALRDAKAGEAYYRALGFGTSHEYPTNTTHALSGRFGEVVAQQLGLYNAVGSANPTIPTSTSTSTPASTSTPTSASTTTTTSTPTPSEWDHQVVGSRTGATLTVDVPPNTSRTTFRVSAFPFGTQTGFYIYTRRTGTDLKLTLSSSLSPGRTYYYQVEAGRNRNVEAAGTFNTANSGR